MKQKHVVYHRPFFGAVPKVHGTYAFIEHAIAAGMQSCGRAKFWVESFCRTPNGWLSYVPSPYPTLDQVQSFSLTDIEPPEI